MPKTVSPIQKIWSATPIPNIFSDEKRLNQKNPLLVIIGTIVIFIILGLLGGLFYVDRSESDVKPLVEEQVNPNEFIGLVKKSSQIGVSHELLSAEGKVTAYLTTNDDKLLLAEERRVTIRGQETNRINSIPVLMVSEVIFK